MSPEPVRALDALARATAVAVGARLALILVEENGGYVLAGRSGDRTDSASQILAGVALEKLASGELPAEVAGSLLQGWSIHRVPLTGQGDKALGVLCALDERGGDWSVEQADVLVTMATAAGAAVELARASASGAQQEELQNEQALRLAAETHERRASFLAEASALLAESLDYELTLTRLTELAVARIADWCAIDMLTPTGTIERLAVAHPEEGKRALAHELHRKYPPPPDAPTGAPHVIRTGEAELVERITPEMFEQAGLPDEQLRLIEALDLCSYMVVPLSVAGRVLGAMTLVSSDPKRLYGKDDLDFALELASRAAYSVDNARLYSENQAARQEAERQGYITRTISENANAALFMLDVNGRCTYLNPSARATTGFELEQLQNRRLHDVIHHHRPDGTPYPAEECPIEISLARGEPIRGQEEHFIRADGSFFPAECAASPIFDAEGHPLGTVVEVWDLTEQHRNQELVRQRDQQFRFLADSIPVQVWTASPDGQLSYVNKQVSSYFGESPEKLVGEGWVGFVNPDQVPEVAERWSRSLSSGEPYEIEFQLRSKDGEYRWHLARARARRDADGRILQWFGSNTDIHQAKMADVERERLIRAKEEERRRLLETFMQAPAFICTLVGPEHIYEFANPPYYQLVGHREIVGRKVSEALPEIVEQGFIELLDRVYQGGEAYEGKEVPITLQREAGGTSESVYVNFVYQPMRDADERVMGILVHGVEVTDQVRARLEMEARAEEMARLARQLQLSNQELDQFAYVASHDLKAPLRGIANLSQWIEEDLANAVNPEVRAHLDLLRGRVSRMEGLIDGILDYSRAGRVKAAPERVRVAELLEEVLDLLSPRQGVEVSIGEGMPTVVTEKLPLQQVFMNLIGNALKFTPAPGGSVKVEVRTEGDFHHFMVSDNGPGIAPEYHERIFGIFQTLAARDSVEGTGIGLSLVRKIVESRGGRVWVESAEGAGATFHFLWPST